MGFLDRFEPLELTGSTPPHDRVDQLLDVTVDQFTKSTETVANLSSARRSDSSPKKVESTGTRWRGALYCEKSQDGAITSFGSAFTGRRITS